MGDLMFSKQDLQTVVTWLEDRRNWLETERLVIERGDNFAATNGKFYRVEDIMREVSAIRSSIKTARDQMEGANE